MQATAPAAPAAGRKRRALDVGLLILRVGIGGMFILHGWPKIAGGEPTWSFLGAKMGQFGVTWAPAFWGFMAAFAEFVGGIMLVVGLFVRPFAFLMLVTMFVASYGHILGAAQKNAVWSFPLSWAHPVTAGVVFLALMITGAGDVSLRAAIRPFRKHGLC
jgi:putative oxidoreductase